MIIDETGLYKCKDGSKQKIVWSDEIYAVGYDDHVPYFWNTDSGIKCFHKVLGDVLDDDRATDIISKWQDEPECCPTCGKEI